MPKLSPPTERPGQEAAAFETAERQVESNLSPLESLGEIPEGINLSLEAQKCISHGLKQANELLLQTLAVANRHLATKESLEQKVAEYQSEHPDEGEEKILDTDEQRNLQNDMPGMRRSAYDSA